LDEGGEKTVSGGRSGFKGKSPKWEGRGVVKGMRGKSKSVCFWGTFGSKPPNEGGAKT